MARPSKRRQSDAPSIEIDVDGVSPKMRVGELTVMQLVEIVAQTVGQVQLAQRLNPAGIAKVLEQLRAGIPKSSSTQAEARVHQMQRELLERMPRLLGGLVERMPRAKSSRKA